MPLPRNNIHNQTTLSREAMKKILEGEQKRRRTMPYDKYAHADAYYEQLEKREYDKGLRERQVKAMEEIACIPEFLDHLTNEIKELRLVLLQHKNR